MKIKHTLTNEEKIKWLQIARSNNIGPATLLDLLKIYKDIDKIIEAIPVLAKKGGARNPISLYPYKETQIEYNKIIKYDADIITYGEAVYPEKLRHISDFPIILTVKGNKEILNDNILAIVGSRNASYNSVVFAKKIANNLGSYGFKIASGLARGIDTAAHIGSLQTGTIAVIGSGINQIYPPENKNLYNNVIDNNGIIISEVEFGSPPMASFFPRRNRIISGLSFGIIVVEAGLKSGSLITARLALEQNKEIWAVPGFPLDPRCKGTNSLIKKGAYLLENIDDIIDVIPDYILNNGSVENQSTEENEIYDNNLDESEMKEIRSVILKSLSTSAVEIDEIIKQTGLPVTGVMSTLLELELAGKLNRHVGNKVSLKVA